MCTGFVWQGFGSRGATGVASVRSCQKLPLCLIEPVPVSSKMDPPLAKAKPVSNDGSTSGITYLRSRKKTLLKNIFPAGGRSGNPTDTKVSEEGGGRGAPGTRAEVPLQPMEVHGGADLHLQPMEDPTPEQVDAQSRL